MPREPQRPGPPRYQQIADDLRAKIDRGEIRAGDRLPTEKELVEQYAPVTVGTVRRALAALQDEGLTVTVHGHGVFVRDYRPILRRSPARLSAEQWGTGRAIWDLDLDERQMDQEVRIEKIPAPPSVVRHLALSGGEYVWKRDRRFSVDGRPVQRAVSHLPASLAEGTAITQLDTGPGGVYARLKEVGHAPVRFTEALRARMPSKTEIQDLDLPPATPVLQITRIAYDAEGLAVEVNDMLLNAYAYLLEYDFPA